MQNTSRDDIRSLSHIDNRMIICILWFVVWKCLEHFLFFIIFPYMGNNDPN